MQAYNKLKKMFSRYSHLNYIQRILMWDEAVMMPEGGEHERALALATLNRSAQKIIMNKKVADLIADAKLEKNLTAWDKVNLNWIEKKYIRASGIPLKLVEQATKIALASEQAWRKLRPLNDWQSFLPYLEKTFLLTRETAERQSQQLGLDTYDVLLDSYAPGFNRANIDAIFANLKNTIPAFIQEIMHKQKDDYVQPSGPFSIEKQKQLGLTAMSALQFDFKRGRLDVSHHPFCSGGPNDVRMTTRYSQEEFLTSFFGICHETGHALYEQGLPQAWLDQPVGQVDSMAMHESQSLLIEMEVCRSLAFIQYLIPLLQQEFGHQAAFTLDNIYKIIIRVRPGFIRVDADEVTYPLHIILRYEIEKALFKDEITIRDLPHVWNEFMTKYLSISTQNNFKDGVMQDVHWPSGAFGYFPAYTLGRLMAAQIFTAFSKDHPHYEKEFASGNFLSLINWLRKNIHINASFLSAHQLLQEVTGEDLNPSYFINHIKRRYLEQA